MLLEAINILDVFSPFLSFEILAQARCDKFFIYTYKKTKLDEVINVQRPDSFKLMCSHQLNYNEPQINT